MPKKADKPKPKNKSGTSNLGEHLCKFKAGESGNPAGRPKGSKDGFRAHLKRRLRTMAPADAIQSCKDMGFEVDEGTVAEVLSTQLVGLAFRGEPSDRLRAMDKIEKTTEEPMKQTHEVNAQVETNVLDESIAGLPTKARKAIADIIRNAQDE